MNKPMRLFCIVILGAVVLYFGARSVDLGAFIMRLHGR